MRFIGTLQMSDAKILQLTPPTPSTEEQPAVSPEMRKVHRDDMKDLIRIGNILTIMIKRTGLVRCPE